MFYSVKKKIALRQSFLFSIKAEEFRMENQVAKSKFKRRTNLYDLLGFLSPKTYRSKNFLTWWQKVISFYI